MQSLPVSAYTFVLNFPYVVNISVLLGYTTQNIGSDFRPIYSFILLFFSFLLNNSLLFYFFR